MIIKKHKKGFLLIEISAIPINRRP